MATRALCFWLLASLARSSEPLDLWLIWTDRDGADFFFTSSTCATVALPDASIVGNELAAPPSNGGISDMLFFVDTFEFVFVEGGKLVRAWMDKTGRSELGPLPGDAPEPIVWNTSATGPSLGEEGALAWTQDAGLAMVFFASSLTNKLWVSNLSSVPPRDASHLGPWMELVQGQDTSARPQIPVLVAKDGRMLWSDEIALRSWNAVDALNDASAGGSSGSTVAQLGLGSDAWGELLAAEASHDGGLLWVRRVDGNPPQLEHVLHLDSLIDGPGANYASGNVRLLHRFSENDEPSAIAVPPSPGPGLPYMGNLTALFQQVYFSILGPEAQARVDHLSLDTGEVSTVVFAGGIERRGANPARPGALSIYPMPDVCVNVGCLYLENAFSHCERCDQTSICDTCFLDTEDWLIKEWYPTHTLWSNCVWLWPIDQAAWVVRTQVQQAKDDGLLPDDFIFKELPPTPGESTPPDTTPPPLTTSARPTTTETSSTITTKTATTTSTSATATTTNPCAAFPPLLGDAVDACRAQIASWCEAEPEMADLTLAPPGLRAQCAAFAWSAEALCSEPTVVDGGPALIPDGAALDGCSSCAEVWGIALLAGLAVLLTVMVCITWCLTTCRRWQAQGAVQDLRAAGRAPINGSPAAGFEAVMDLDSALNAGTGSSGQPSRRLPRWKSCARRLRCPCFRGPRAASKVKPSPPTVPSSPKFEDEEDRRPDSSMSSTGVGDISQASAPVEQIMKGTWQPELSSAGAAAAAGRLSDAMRRFMSPGNDEAARWRFLDDVEDILRTLGSALPTGVRNAAWAWHARQSARLHRSHALTAALEEARSMADDFREDLSDRLASGVRRLEASALLEAVGGASKEDQDNDRAPLSLAERESLAKASRIEEALEQLKTRMESLSGSSGVKGDLLHAGHLLDCQQALQRLLREQEEENERLLREGGDSAPSGGAAQLWQQLGEDIRQMQEAVATKLHGSDIASERAGGAPSSSTASFLELGQSAPRLGPDRKAQTTRKVPFKSWLQGLKQAAARAASFAAALRDARTQKDKKKLEEMESLLNKEMQSCKEAERAAQAGGEWTGQQSDAWRQLNGVWSGLKEELEAVDRSGAATDQEKDSSSPTLTRGSSKLLNYAATRRANLMLPPKRSDTRSLDAEELAAAGPGAQASSARLDALRKELAKLRDKVQQSSGAHGKDPESLEQRLLMSGLMELHRQDLQKLIEAVEAEQRSLGDSSGDDAMEVRQTLGTLWQQLKGELEDLHGQLDLSQETGNTASPGSTAGGLSAGIGSSLLSPSKSGKLARLPSKLKRPTLPKALTEAASKYLRASEGLAKLRWQRSQLADSHPLLRLGQAAAEEEVLAGLDANALRALEMNEGWEGNDKEWSALQGLWRQLRKDVAEAQAASNATADSAALALQGAEDEDAGERRGNRTGLSAGEDAEGSQQHNNYGKSTRRSSPNPHLPAWGEHEASGPGKLALASRHLAKLEEELELQRQDLARSRQMEQGEDGGALLVGHALLYQSQVASLAAARDACRKELQELLEAGYADGWSQEQLAACEKLAARCQDLENSLRFCTEQASLLKEDAEQALGSGGASSTIGALVAAALRASDPELRAALSEALRRMANFDHDLEKQRAALKRRRKKEPGAMADDATLTALVVERGQAVAQCQDFAQKMPAQAWNLVLSMWQGKLTDGLERLAMRPGGDDETEDLSENEAARQRRRLLVGRGEAVDPSAALLEARRRLAQLAEEAERQRLGLKPRRRWRGRSGGDEASDEDSSLEEQALRASAVSAWGEAATGPSDDAQLLQRAQRGLGRSAWTAAADPSVSTDAARPASLGEAAQRLAGLEAQLRAQQKSLRRLEQQKRSGQADDVLLAEHALLNHGALEALAAERRRCRRELQQLLEVASAEGWSEDQRAAYDELEAQCRLLEESFKSLDETAALLQEGTEEAAAAPGAAAAIQALEAALAGKVDDPELRAALDVALKCLSRFDADLAEQRAALKRRRGRSSSSTDRPSDATELSALVKLVDKRSDALAQCEDFAYKIPSELWHLILSLWRGKLTDDLQHLLHQVPGVDEVQDALGSDHKDGRRSRLGIVRDEPVDPEAALREARRRLVQLAEEAERQRAGLKQRRRQHQADEASPQSLENGSSSTAGRSRRVVRVPAADSEAARRAVAEAARRLASFEDQLEIQRCGLQRRQVQKQRGEVDDLTLLGHALLHHSELEALAAEREGCRQECEQLLQVAGREDWSGEDSAACEQLAARCRDLEDSFRCCTETAALLRSDAAEAAPSAQLPDAERQAALEEALRRVARFDHDVEAQREALRRRRRKGGEAAVDATLASLLEQKREAMVHCEELGRDSSSEAWSLIDSLWRGKLTESLEQLTIQITIQAPSGEEQQHSEGVKNKRRQLDRSEAVDTSEAVAEARRRLAQLSEDAERQRLGLRPRRKRGKAEEAVKEELEQIAASGAEFGALAAEHCEGLQEQEKSLSEVMQKDSEAMDEIEAWRQLVGLEELQAAASKMAERLADEEAGGRTVADLPGLSPSRLKRQNTKGDMTVDTSAAKQQCEEMKARLLELRGEEEDRQRLLLQRRQRRKRQEPPADAEEVALEVEGSSRELLLKAHECLVEGSQKNEELQELRQKLRELRVEGSEEPAQEEEEEEEQAAPPVSEPEPAKPPKEPPKEELLAALAASEQRTDWVSSMAADLLSQLEVVFDDRSQDAHLGSAVAAVVDRWRNQLPKENKEEAAEAAAPSMECLGRLGDVAQKALAQQVVAGEERDLLLGNWRSQLVGAAQATEKQSSNEQEEIRARALARRRERQQQRAQAASETVLRKSRWKAVKQVTASKSFKTPAAAEVKRYRSEGESLARSFYRNTEEEEEQQARRMLRRLEERRSRAQSRSRPSTAAPSAEASPLQRGLMRSTSLASFSAWSPQRRVGLAVDVTTEGFASEGMPL